MYFEPSEFVSVSKVELSSMLCMALSKAARAVSSSELILIEAIIRNYGRKSDGHFAIIDGSSEIIVSRR